MVDLRITADTPERFAVQGWHAPTGETSAVIGAYALVLFLSFQLWRRTDALQRLSWVLAGVGTLLSAWFMISIKATGGIEFDLDIDRDGGVWTTQAVYPKEHEYFHEPVTRALGDVLRVDLVPMPGKGGDTPENQRILITLQDGTTFEPFESEERGDPKEMLVLDRLQKMLVPR